jgi:hypothetical protein
MGGSGSEGFSRSDMERLQKAAEERLRALASQSTLVLFACEVGDRRSLDSHLARSTVFEAQRLIVVDGTQENEAEQALDKSSFLILFTNTATETRFLSGLADKALLKKRAGLHVKANPDAVIPSKVMAYRWRSVTWQELETIFG